jgi:hypothetical protein
MAMEMSVLVFCAEDGDGMFVQKIGIYLQVHMMLLSGRPTLT